MESSNTYTFGEAQVKPCPNGGYCPCCGRRNNYEMYPYHYTYYPSTGTYPDAWTPWWTIEPITPIIVCNSSEAASSEPSK